MASVNGLLTSLNSHRFFNVVALVVGVWSTWHWVICKQDHFGFTPFTADSTTIEWFWSVLSVLQLLFVFQFWSTDTSVQDNAKMASPGFFSFMVLETLWALFFGHIHSRWANIVSWAIMVVALLNVYYHYCRNATVGVGPISRWWFIHVPTQAMPGVWALYVFFWNGAIALQWDDKRPGAVVSILSHVFIWAFLVDSFFVTWRYNDWGVAFATAFLVCGICDEQKGLQHWFAMAISILVFLYGFIVAYPDIPHGRVTKSTSTPGTGENAPLLS